MRESWRERGVERESGRERSGRGREVVGKGERESGRERAGKRERVIQSGRE